VASLRVGLVGKSNAALVERLVVATGCCRLNLCLSGTVINQPIEQFVLRRFELGNGCSELTPTPFDHFDVTTGRAVGLSRQRGFRHERLQSGVIGLMQQLYPLLIKNSELLAETLETRADLTESPFYE
jgi:hypothetical protein